MARRESRPDPKETALAAARCLNPHPEHVRDAEFLSSEFFDARDVVQVKYEMVRKVKADGAPVTAAAAAFGYSRPSYYEAAAALERSGLEGLVQAWPGLRAGHKLTEQILAWAEDQLAACALRPAQLPARIEQAFGVRVHPRTVERALARRRERHSKSRCDLPARETREEEHPSLSPRPSPGRAAAEPGARPDAGQVTAPGGGLMPATGRTASCRLHARAEAFPLGSGVLTRGGVTAWRTPWQPRAAGPGHGGASARLPRTCPAQAAGLPAPVAAELISVLAAVALAAACRPRNRLLICEGDPMLPDTAASKVTAANLSRTALLYVRQSSLKQVIHNTESAVRQYDLRGKAIALGWDASQITVIDIDQGQSGASAADREGFQQLVAEVSLGRAGIVLGLECSRLARNSADWHQLLELCGMTGTLICDEDGLYDPRNFNDRLLLGLKGALSEAELHFIRARLRGGQLSKARRGELVMPLPIGLVYDAAGHVILDPDTAIQGALRHLFTTFEATGSATACVKAFRAAGLSFPWRHRKDPAKARSAGSRCATTPCCVCCTTPATPACSPTAGPPTRSCPAAKPAPGSCPATSGPPSSPAPTPDTSPWTSTKPTSPRWPPTPPRTAATAPPGRPAKAPPSCRASSSAAAAATG